MQYLRRTSYVWLVLLTLLAACAPNSTPTATAAPAASAPAVPSPTTLVAVPSDTTTPPTLVAVSLSGPPMAVGSMYPYVDGTILVAVPGGPFTMGHGGSDNPQHIVTLGDFWIYSTKVTNQEYARCVASGQCTAPNLIDNLGYTEYPRANDPVVGINYDQSAAYCTYVHGRLPTEAEWEKTARGPDANVYPWGNGAPSCDFLNFNNCVGKTTNVTKYPPGQSYYHALDMEGNSFEWVADWYNALYYKTGPADDPLGPSTGLQRSIRSSGYKSIVDQVPASTRFFDLPKSHHRDLGFRCVVMDPTYFAPACEQLGLFGSGVSGNGNPGGNVQANCPIVSVLSTTQTCKDGFAYVTFKSTDPGATTSGVAGCLLVSGGPGYPQVYKCTSKTTATIDAVCSFSGLGEAKCPAHYSLDGGTGTCKWDGTGSIGEQCIAGQTYDPVNQCCTATPGSGTNFPLCQVGSSLVNLGGGKFGCLASQAAPPAPHASTAVVMPPACPNTGGGTGTPGACTLTCPLYYKLDPATCTCVYNYSP
jgi:formylglycine-generating enzyme required for sulfatase activity